MQRLYVIAFAEMAEKDALGLEALRAAHDAEGHAILPAHFTFVFGCDCVSAAVATEAVRSVAGAAAPIDFVLSRATRARHGGFHYVFLCPEQGASEMLELHEKLHTGPLARCLDARQQFTPHLTICRTVHAKEARAVLEQLERSPPRIQGGLRTLTLEFVADGAFRPLARAPLGSAG